MLPKARPNSAGPTAGDSSRLTIIPADTLWALTPVFQPSSAERSDGDANNQGAGKQSRPVRQNTYPGYSPQFYKGLCCQRESRDNGNEGEKNQGTETQGQQPSQHWYHSNFSYGNRYSENPKSSDDRQKYPLHQLGIRPLRKLNRAGLSTCWLTTITITWFSHSTRRNEYEIPSIRNERKIGAKDRKCLVFAH